MPMMSATQTLLTSLIDYAGLLPPAARSMREAVDDYIGCRQGPHTTGLGRFVVPASRLADFAAVHARLPAPAQPGWELSLVVDQEPGTAAAQAEEFNRSTTEARIVSFEVKVDSPAAIAQTSALFPASLPVWMEIPLDGDIAPLLRAIKAAERRAKIRTGGPTADSFPVVTDVLRFLTASHALKLPFKASSGLQHALHGNYPIPEAPGDQAVPMSGFINLFLAASFLHNDGSARYALALLGDTEPGAFHPTPDALLWRGYPFRTAQLAAARREFCQCFSCCSFTRPLAELQALGWT